MTRKIDTLLLVCQHYRRLRQPLLQAFQLMALSQALLQSTERRLSTITILMHLHDDLLLLLPQLPRAQQPVHHVCATVRFVTLAAHFGPSHSIQGIPILSS